MFRKTIVISFLCLIAASLGLTAAEETGYALLDKLVLTFKTMAEKRSGGKEVVDQALAGMMAEAKEAKAKGKVDSIFFKRYERILIVLKLSLLEDPSGILWSLVEREIERFYEDIKGEKFEGAGKKIGPFADAVAQEILNLHIYLDTKPERQNLMKKMEEKSTKIKEPY